MCGIVAYLGTQKAAPILLSGLSKLEYRGYDSAGISVIENGTIETIKCKGKVENLEEAVLPAQLKSYIGIAHTRWATHGEPNVVNAHPHTSQNGRISIVHNGIIENYQSLKTLLQNEGFTFESDTDSEVIAHLLEHLKRLHECTTEAAFRRALSIIEGAYAIVVLDQDNPDGIIAARKSSPLVLGMGVDEYILSSDTMPMVKYVDEVIYLEDDQVLSVSRDEGYRISSLDNETIDMAIEELKYDIEEAEKGLYEYFMLKEIYEQPKTLTDSMRGRINFEEGWIALRGILDKVDQFKTCSRVIFVACGTSWHTGLIAEYLFEDIARIPCEVEYASEFRYRNPIIGKGDLVVAISQSGETADTLAALAIAKEKGAMTYGIVNAVGSTIARITDTGSYTHAGPEIGVASTKAFTSQVSIVTMMALQLGLLRNEITQSECQKYLESLERIPSQIVKILAKDDQIQRIAQELVDSDNAIYLGRGVNFPVALEGALKLKEISYIHAEGYPAAEMKHGPIALIDENMPIVAIATNRKNIDKMISNLEEVKARKGRIIAIVDESVNEINHIADHIISIPQTMDHLTPLLSVIPLQLISYHVALLRGCDVDRPRNLAKSVTVE